MKFLQCILFYLIAPILIIPCISGQTSGAGFDSVSILKPQRNQNLYKFVDSVAREIQYSMNQPKEAKFVMDAGHIIGGTAGLLTVVTGINFTSARELNWKVDGAIKCKDALSDWDISLFCEGYLEKDRQRGKNDDGSWSIVTEKTRDLYWENNATGVIIESIDTIGAFLIIMDPWTNPLLKQWSAAIFSEPELKIKTASNNKSYKKKISYPDISYGIFGEFRGEEFVIISNGTARKTWFYSNKSLSCIFWPDMDDSLVSNKDRIQPYLLINEEISHSERRDFFRLAIMSRFLSRTLKL